MISAIHNIDRLQVVLIFISVFVLTFVFRLFRTWSTLKHVPGPTLASLTNLERVRWVKTGAAHLHYRALHDRYGEVVRMGPNMVSVSSPEALSTIYPIRPGFPKGDFYATLRPYNKERGSMLAVFNTQNEDMHKLIKTPIAPLFSLSNVIQFEGLVDETLQLLSEQLNDRFAGKNEVFDLGDWLQYFAFESMGMMSFSKTYGFLEHGYDVGGMLGAIFGFMKTAAPMTQMTWLDPILYKNSWVHDFRRTPGMSILATVGRLIQERRQVIEKEKDSDSSGGHKDFLTSFMQIHQSNPHLPPWASTAWTFSNIIAGSDSVGAIMQTTLYNLLSHPATYEKLQRELDAANLSLPFPTWSQVRDLPYLDACIKEASRIHPPFALPFERVVPAGGITVLDTYLPEGTLVAGNPYVMNRHVPTFGEDADEWNPERWLEGDDAHKKKLDQSILTFGSGRRVCLGKHIGIFEVKKVIPFLMLNYNLRIIDPKSLTEENAFFFKQRGFNCTIEKRVN